MIIDRTTVVALRRELGLFRDAHNLMVIVHDNLVASVEWLVMHLRMLFWRHRRAGGARATERGASADSRRAGLGVPDGFRIVQPGQAFVPGALAGVADVDDEE
jgi:hypothetical protein